MGNYNFAVKNLPAKGQHCMIVDSQFSRDQKYPRSVYFQGQRVRVLGSTALMCSRNNFPTIHCTLVEFENGKKDVYLSNNLERV